MWTDEQRKRTDARGVLQSDMMDAGWSELGPLIPDAARAVARACLSSRVTARAALR